MFEPYEIQAHIHSLMGDVKTVKVIEEKGANDFIVEYNGKKCTAIRNVYNGEFYADDKSGIIAEEKQVIDFDKKTFAQSMNENHEKLHILKLKYLATQLHEAEIEKLFADAYNTVLKEHKFYAVKDCERMGIKLGDRITTNDNDFCMSKKDFNKYLNYSKEIMFERGYVKEDGKYKDGYNGSEIRREAENKLVDFFISILPQNMREALSGVHNNYTHKKKLLDIIMGETEAGKTKQKPRPVKKAGSKKRKKAAPAR